VWTRFFGGFVLLIFLASVLCFVLFVCLFVCRRSVSNVADVSGFIHSWLPLWFSLGLSILDCPFCFLWRLYKTSSPLLHVVSYLTPDSRGNTILPIFHLNSFNFFSMFDFTCIVHEKNVLPYQSTWFHQYPRLSGDCSIFSFLCSALLIIVCPFVLFLLAIALSVIPQFTACDFPFRILKHFWNSRATCLPADCCFSELTLYKFN